LHFEFELACENWSTIMRQADHPQRGCVLLALSMALAALPCAAQTYPTRPVRLIVGFAPGGSVDIVARLMGQRLSARLGQQFVIENRPGAGTNIATELVVRATPDGYTLLMVVATNTINTTLYEKLNFNFIRDIAPVAGIARVPNVMEVNPSVSAKTVPEFIAYAKANPGKFRFGSGGNGSTQHLAGELFKMMAGIDMVHVPYRGGSQALIDLLGGQIQVMFDTIPGSIEYIRSGKLRALAVTTATRLDVLPGIPAVSEVVSGYEATGWQGIGVPKNTPAEVIGKLNKEINAGLADAVIKARIADLGGTVLVLSPAEFGKLIAAETEKWAKVVKFSGAKVD
jgi:tripartite-type tricarboxylate transporter receptor subunit TctC